jgi:hypothetical protein
MIFMDGAYSFTGIIVAAGAPISLSTYGPAGLTAEPWNLLATHGVTFDRFESPSFAAFGEDRFSNGDPLVFNNSNIVFTSTWNTYSPLSSIISNCNLTFATPAGTIQGIKFTNAPYNTDLLIQDSSIVGTSANPTVVIDFEVLLSALE